MKISEMIKADGPEREGAGQDDMTALITNLETAQDAIAGAKKRMQRLAANIDPKSASLFKQAQDKLDKCGMIIVKVPAMLRKVSLK